MTCARLVRLAGIATALAFATTSWPQVRVLPSDSPPVIDGPRCDSSTTGSSIVGVHPVREGIWKGFTVFSVMCGPIKGDLLFGSSHNSLRFAVAQDPGQNRDAAFVPLPVRTELLRLLLQRFFATSGRRLAYSFATSSFPEIGARLAAASAASPAWDREAGQPRNSTVNEFTKRMMNEKETYPELSKVFRDVGYDLRVSGTEDVLVLSIKQMSAADKVFIKGQLLPTDKLPVSAATYFRLDKRLSN
jgi:hypothetical protein